MHFGLLKTNDVGDMCLCCHGVRKQRHDTDDDDDGLD